MGGRGSKSGISNKGIKYGKEYHCIFEVKNIKFVERNNGATSAPLETQTSNRIYVTINSEDKTVQYISFYKDGEKYKTIDVGKHNHWIKNSKTGERIYLGKVHKHLGKNHDENGSDFLTDAEKSFVRIILKIWKSHNETN